MTFSAKGFQTLGNMGTPDGTSGSRRNCHTYITNDTAAQVETSDYFLAIYQQLKVGDILFASIDVDGTRTVRTYVFDAVASDGVDIVRETTAVTGDQTAIADLTENSTDIGGSQDSNFASLSVAWNGSTDPTAAEGALLIDAIRENAAKTNAILAMLRASGALASS